MRSGARWDHRVTAAGPRAQAPRGVYLGLCYGLLGYSGGLCHTVSLFIVCFPILIVILHYILRRILHRGGETSGNVVSCR